MLRAPPILLSGCLSVGALTCIGHARGVDTLYVDDSAPDGGNGASWATAFRYLQDALAAARNSRTVTEIRVGQGIYKPDHGLGLALGDQHASFDLVSSVALRGGYAGTGAVDPNERDFERFNATLSGDLLGNDQPNFVNYADNAHRIVRMSGGSNTLVEGFTITSSQWEPNDSLPGGGLYCTSGSLMIHDCRFQLNRAYSGGGMALIGGVVHIARCHFANNWASYGAGIVSATIPLPMSPMVLIEDCMFIQNQAWPEDGGGIVAGPNTTIRRSTFLQNVGDDGGALTGHQAVIEDCLFVGNAADYGGAVADRGTYRRCVFQNNYASTHGGAYGTAIPGAASDTRFIDCLFVANRTGWQGGGACYGGREFIGCVFLGNLAGVNNGQESGRGGAIEVSVTSSVSNCVFSGNHGEGTGGAISVPAGVAVSITNATFASNASDGLGAAVYGPATICNSVFGPHAGTLLSGVTSVDYSCLPLAWPGAGNIVAADPGFVNALGPDGVPGTEDDDLRLRPDSPCIDAGNSNALPADAFDLDDDGNLTEPLPLDAFGNARILETPATPNTGVPLPSGSAIVDMGAHEYRRPADIWPLIGDGAIAVTDLLEVINHWGPCPSPPDPDEPCHADINGDGAVAVWDLLQVIFNWD